MSVSIVIDIEPDADGVRCGECKMMRYLINCPFMDEHSVSTCLRGPACIAAQARYTRMVEALRECEKLRALLAGWRGHYRIVSTVDEILADMGMA